MIKKLWLTTFFLLLMVSVAWSQSDLSDFNSDRLDINRKGMLVLGSWAVLNLASSPILASRTQGVERAFHQMNGYWNAVNLIIAGFGYYSAAHGPVGLSLVETLQAQQSIEKILLFNTALDLGYITGGFLLRERSKSITKHRERLNGFGNSLLLQGGFLFVFDIALYLTHQNHAEGLFNWVDQLSVHPVGFSLIWKV